MSLDLVLDSGAGISKTTNKLQGWVVYICHKLWRRCSVEEGNPKTLTPDPQTPTKDRVCGLPMDQVGGLPMDQSMDYPSPTDPPPPKKKM